MRDATLTRWLFEAAVSDIVTSDADEQVGKELLAHDAAQRAEIARLSAEAEALRDGVQRIFDMSVRPKCVCGVPTGTDAIKACAERVLDSARGKEREE